MSLPFGKPLHSVLGGEELARRLVLRGLHQPQVEKILQQRWVQTKMLVSAKVIPGECLDHVRVKLENSVVALGRLLRQFVFERGRTEEDVAGHDSCNVVNQTASAKLGVAKNAHAETLFRFIAWKTPYRSS